MRLERVLLASVLAVVGVACTTEANHATTTESTTTTTPTTAAPTTTSTTRTTTTTIATTTSTASGDPWSVDYPLEAESVDDLPAVLTDKIDSPEPDPDLNIEGPDDLGPWVDEWLGWFSWVNANPEAGVAALVHAAVPGSSFYEETLAALESRVDEGTRLLGYAFRPLGVSATFDEFFERGELLRLVVDAEDTVPRYEVGGTGSVVRIHEPLGGQTTLRLLLRYRESGGEWVLGEPRSRWVVGLLVALVVANVPATPATAEDECHFDPALGLVCEDHGGDGGSGSSTSYWTSWQIVGQCGGGGVVGSGLIDLTSGQLLALRDHIVDGEVVETQAQCIDLDGSETLIWEAIASAVRSLPDPTWQSDPDGSVSVGLTGLETWLWYSNPTQVGPIEATWIEPVTGIAFGVRGRGWTESIDWDTGERTHEVFAARWDEAPGPGGSLQSPAARHVYDTTSTAAGFNGGYPVSLGLLWVGEYQITVVGGVWTDWARFASTLSETTSDTYEVVEVRSRLSG